MMTIISIIGWILLILGSFFCFAGALGLIRFPDFYSRVHAAGVLDSLGTILVLLGLITQTQDVLVIIKLVLILVFLIITGPTAVHALARAARHSEINTETHDN